MNLPGIIDFYRYNAWANGRIVSAIEPLSPEAFDRNLGGSFPTIRGTFAHIVAAEWIWLERWSGRNPTAAPDWVSSADRPVLVSYLHDVEDRRNTFLAAQSETSLAASLPFRFLNGNADAHTLSDLLVHVVNHSSYHRGQVASMLRQVGSSAPSTDLIVFRTVERAATA
jgi:uncharacterized damage-inducible protein DinB